MATAVAAVGNSAVPQKQSHPFTCVTCAIAFRSSELQRGHMRSDWHRYNLKRRVASLPPLTSEVFAEKVISAQASSKAAAEKASFEKLCQACEKTYYSENAFRNHLGSQRHKMRLAVLQTGGVSGLDDASSVMSSTVSLGEPMAPENVDDPAIAAEFQEVIEGMKNTELDEKALPAPRRPSRPHPSVPESASTELRSTGTETPSVADTTGTITSTAMPINRCIFCNYDSTDLDTSVNHMTREHGLFIPERPYLEDLEGLVTYLQAKVAENGECIYCHKLKNTVSGIQTHMRDKGHCMIAFNTEEEMLEVGQFYDFSSTYSDEDQQSTDDEDTDTEMSKGVKLGAARKASAQQPDDEEWESDDSEEDSQDEAGPRPTKRTQRNNNNVAYAVGGELYLPSGRTAGHRSLAKYFRQNLRNYPTAEERAEQQQKLLTEGDKSEDELEGESENSERQIATRADGGLGMLGVTDTVKRAVQATEKKELRNFDRKNRQYQWGIQRRANNQTHFRDDNFGYK